MKGANSNYMKHATTLPLAERRPLMNHEWQAITFQTDDTARIYLDQCIYETIHPLRFTKQGVMISETDFYRIYAPDLNFSIDGSEISLEFTDYIQYADFSDRALAGCPKREIVGGVPYMPVTDIQEAVLKLGSPVMVTDRGKIDLEDAPYLEGEIHYLPVVEIMQYAFGANVQRLHEGTEKTFWARALTERDTISISFSRDFSLTKPYANALTRSRSKVYGDIYGTYWFPEGRRVMPYRVYVPYAYDSSKPQKALVTFPGGLANENSYFDRVPGGGFQREAEVHDYLVIGLTGYGVSTFFGSRIPILQTLDGIDYEHAGPENPENWPQETLDLRAIAEQGMWTAMKEIERKWNVDKENLFAMGNSAGSNSTMYFFLKYPEVFRAAVPTGGFINYHFADMSQIRPGTLLHIIGTEDEYGFDDMIKAYAELDRLGIQYKKMIIGGGNHSLSWTFAVKDIFDFLDSNVR